MFVERYMRQKDTSVKGNDMEGTSDFSSMKVSPEVSIWPSS